MVLPDVKGEMFVLMCLSVDIMLRLNQNHFITMLCALGSFMFDETCYQFHQVQFSYQQFFFRHPVTHISDFDNDVVLVVDK